MGNCNKSQTSDPLENLTYTSQVALRIKEKDYYGRTAGIFRTQIQLKPPSYTKSSSILLSDLMCHVSGSVLSNLDPREEIEKDCQDAIFSISHLNMLLLGLFDGHGKEGLPVVSFCKKFLKSFFLSHSMDFTKAPAETLSKSLTDCDAALHESSGLDTSLSGTTAVLCLIQDRTIYVANVGDSRAVCGQTGNTEKPTKSSSKSRSPFQSNPGRFYRQIVPSKILNATALTIDQTPDLPEEFERITQTGARVKQLQDETGNKIGPFRVWAPTKNLPGLAMSRSIGDSIAKSLGVVATPVVTSYTLDHSFLILASDGVWNVMDEQEAVNFAEKFRRSASRKTSQKTYPLKVNTR